MQGAALHRSVPSMRTETPETAAPVGPATVTTMEPVWLLSPSPRATTPNVTAASPMSKRRRAGPLGRNIGGNTEPVTGATD